MSKISWPRSKELQRKTDARSEIEEHRSEGYSQLNAIENMNDRAWLGAIISEPHITPEMKETVARSLVYLEENPTRPLAPQYREKFRRYDRALACARDRVSRGLPPFDAHDPSKVRRVIFRTPRAPRPAWMNDPTLLPKRPPGAK